jgi:hypothetical protein
VDHLVAPALKLRAWPRKKYYHSPQDTAVRVFISYSHDSAAHKDRVWDLCERLRNDGIDCRIDQHEFSPAEGWPRWCRSQVQGLLPRKDVKTGMIHTHVLNRDPLRFEVLWTLSEGGMKSLCLSPCRDSGASWKRHIDAALVTTGPTFPSAQSCTALRAAPRVLHRMPVDSVAQKTTAWRAGLAAVAFHQLGRLAELAFPEGMPHANMLSTNREF